MNLATYLMDGPRIGVVEGGQMWDLRRVMTSWLLAIERNVRARKIAEALVPDDMALFVRLNHGGLAQFRDALAWARENRETCESGAAGAAPVAVPLGQVRLLPPIVQPSKVICVGNSYADYLVDQKLPKDEWPKDVKISFLKSPTALIGHQRADLLSPGLGGMGLRKRAHHRRRPNVPGRLAVGRRPLHLRLHDPERRMRARRTQVVGSLRQSARQGV